ncbi:MAG: class I SAM-dependent methyltransferase [Candidatus Paceibacterota bacterium]|jgi:SAM-dependent methyltransferase
MKISHYQTLYTYELEHWWYRVRREIVVQLIRKHSVNSDRRTILDIGCGTGALLQALEPFGSVIGVDPSEQAINFCKKRGIKNLFLESCAHLSFSDNTFDVVLALDVLEHIDDVHQALQELLRVTKQGGTVIIFVPAFEFLWSVTDVLSEHKRRYTKNKLLKDLRDAGFDIVRTSYFNFFLFPPIFLVRMISRLPVFAMKNENIFTRNIWNRFLYLVFHAEGKLLHYTNYPFGVSIMCVARKKSANVL